VDELDEEADKAHYRKADGGCHSDLLKLFSVRFRTSFNEPD